MFQYLLLTNFLVFLTQLLVEGDLLMIWKPISKLNACLLPCQSHPCDLVLYNTHAEVTLCYVVEALCGYYNNKYSQMSCEIKEHVFTYLQ